MIGGCNKIFNVKPGTSPGMSVPAGPFHLSQWGHYDNVSYQNIPTVTDDIAPLEQTYKPNDVQSYD